MRITTRIDQNRRDFTADYVCDACGYIERGRGYDDANFHENVIPAMACPECGATGFGQTSWPIVPAGVVL